MRIGTVSLLTVIFSVLVIIAAGIINMRLVSMEYNNDELYMTSIRKIQINESEQNVFGEDTQDGVRYIVGVKKNIIEKIACKNLYPADDMPVLYKNVMQDVRLCDCIDIYSIILGDIRFFPVPYDIKNGVSVSYENSWGDQRNYGGKRSHEGTDIMAGNNVRGYFPVVSMTDGVVEKAGWLKLGGYRIGVRSPSGAYYYYAHLNEFAEGIEEGTEVTAGTVLGTMGDTGYSEVEGTTGKFPVHLHLGIYIDIDGKEVSFNPYHILRIVEKYRREFI